MKQICLNYSIELYWHMGYTMRVEEIPSDFRGPTMPSLTKRIAKNEYIDARLVGAAVNDLKRNPELWSDRGDSEDVLQELKYMWHVLVRFGQPFSRV